MNWSSALFAACLIEVNKKVDGKYAKVGDVTIHVPTLDCFGITAEQAKDKDGALLVDERQFAGGGINREGTDAADVLAIRPFHIADGKEILLGRMNRNEARIASLGCQLRFCQRTSGHIETSHVDAFAAVLGIRVRRVRS